MNVHTIKKGILSNIANIPGWRTNRHIVVIESDDWGSIRMSSLENFNRMLKAGMPVDKSHYNLYDALECNDDLVALMETLSKFKDVTGRPPVFTGVNVVANPDFEKITRLEELEIVDQDYMSVTMQLKPTEKVYEYVTEVEKINSDIEAEEERIREELSKKISEKEKVILDNCEKMGALDLALARALYSVKYHLVKPEIIDEHVIEFEDGRNLQVEDIIRSKGKEYCPVSISLKDGVTLITGANMGGKTISLKLAGQVPILAQYGFFVPAKKAKTGLSNYMQILIGDSQSVERGLSSFGSEMEELKEILDHGQNRSLILIDEIASGTNPTEGTALTKSLVDYLMEKPYISLITTHFESVTEKEGVVNLQVRGLADCDFRLLNREIQRANRRERINIISKYMDYRLCRVDNGTQVPKEALSIAAMLGLDKAIIEGAKKYIR